MDVGLGSPGMFLLLCGGLAAVSGKALARRDGPAALATGIAAVAAGDAAGLSGNLLAVARTVVVIGLISAAGSVALRWLTGARSGFGMGLAVFCVMGCAIATQHVSAAGEAGATPLAIGLTVQQQLQPLFGSRASG